MASHRICQKTGLALTSGPVSAVRVARESYGPLNPPPRFVRDDVSSWSRYDTVGRTVYASADPQTAYMELLAPYRTDINRERRALQSVADFMEVPLDDLWRDIVEEWDRQGTMKASWLPRVFREGRALYTLNFPAGWWVDIAATETLAALSNLAGSAWPSAQGPIHRPLTLSDLTGDDRTLTTAIAAYLRDEVTVDDGSELLGIQFTSKHGHPAGGSGTCWAYWMRAVDLGLTEPAQVYATHPITEADVAYAAALDLCRIKSR